MGKTDDSMVEVEAVRIRLAGEVHTLTIAQARKLKDELDRLFGSSFTWNYQPICTRPHRDDWIKPWQWQTIGLCSTADNKINSVAAAPTIDLGG